MQEEFLITLLEAIAKYGSISEAAKQLYVTQPYISKTLRQYETALGLKLIDRSGKPLILTYAGAQYLSQLKKIEQSYKKLDHQMAEIAAYRKGTVIIGTTQTLYDSIMRFIVPEFIIEYPGVKVNVIVIDESKALPALLQKTLDYFIGLPIYDRKISYLNFAYTNTELLVPHTSKLYDRNTKHPVDFNKSLKDLNNERFISYTASAKLTNVIDNFLSHNKIIIDDICTVNDAQLATSLAVAGIGNAFIPRNVLQQANLYDLTNNYNVYHINHDSLKIAIGASYVDDDNFIDIFDILNKISARTFSKLYL